ncbi:hypothetical protein J7444_08135 [Labrenzia sp. R4_1]|uniref:hypothetical protein n=1 Tax=Labrenzia sp. R4_1 TaxID=2821106 RepID=UPI001ADAD45D|nr:hypothetical protein [Labrenzia sp. R4_1]MBO9424686.1 hypothetical protein [Labrenzia sp. R4_1]
MPVFDQFRRELHSQTDGMWAEQVRIVAFKEGREDPARPAVVIEAVLRVNSRSNQNLAGDRSGDWSANVRTGGAELRIDRAKYPDLVLEKDDKVFALERPGAPVWRVSSVDSRGHGRVIVHLGDSR